jgi:hypothetical protein
MYEVLITGLMNMAQILTLYLAADLLGGIFHWAEDTLGHPDDPFWGKVFVQPNEIHHEQPNAMIQIPWLKNNVPILIATLSVVALAVLLDAVTWQLLAFAGFAGWNQQVHRFSHAPRQRLPGVVKWLQKVGVLQNARHHWKHHTAPHLTHYCVLTPWLNPVLDRLGFWRGMERVLVPLFGAPRREDLKGYSWYRN